MRRLSSWVVGLTFVTCGIQAQTPVADDPLLEGNVTASASGGNEARGVLRARDQAVLASELAGRIVELPFSEGESFKKGDTLARSTARRIRPSSMRPRRRVVVPVKSWRITGNWRH